ncbi:MAG: MFS transporter [Verrucomicrobiota bacterium]
MLLRRLALIMVVAVDMCCQGMMFPLFNELINDPASGFYSAEVSGGARQFSYGVLLAVFYLFWFFGAAYISRLSDFIGRKKGITICLGGAFIGYVLTIVGILTKDYWVLLLSRAIAGFTAGNQPIAQAAFVDISRSDDERSRNLGLFMVGVSVGLVGGPLLAGLFGSPEVLGPYASLWLPFAFAAGLVLLTWLLVEVAFREPRPASSKIAVSLVDVVTNLLRLRHRPTVVKISLVFFFVQMGQNFLFIYVANYLTQRFDFSTFHNSIVLVVLGVAMCTGGLVVAPLIARLGKIRLVAGGAALVAVTELAFLLNPVADLSYVLVFPPIALLSIMYPTMLALYSESVGPDEQGWVMGITVAMFTSGCAIISFSGGLLMGISYYLPIVAGILSALIGMGFMLAFGRQNDVRALETSGLNERDGG